MASGGGRRWAIWAHVQRPVIIGKPRLLTWQVVIIGSQVDSQPGPPPVVHEGAQIQVIVVPIVVAGFEMQAVLGPVLVRVGRGGPRRSAALVLRHDCNLVFRVNYQLPGFGCGSAR